MTRQEQPLKAKWPPGEHNKPHRSFSIIKGLLSHYYICPIVTGPFVLLGSAQTRLSLPSWAWLDGPGWQMC